MVSAISDAVLNASHNSISVCRDLAPLRSERAYSVEPSKTVLCLCHVVVSDTVVFPLDLELTSLSSELKALVLSHNQLSIVPGLHTLTELNSLG